ncbi:MAG TPA: sorbosone dehydrogenase family protein, partial [Deinococcales bacterium]|nr:sorbosone dehydrogenase family protein [Deinococcales bacterium]
MTHARPARPARLALAFSALVLSACAALTAASSAQTAGNLKVPDGFRIDVYASGLSGPRLMAVSPNGDLFVSEPGAGRVLVLPDRNKDGRPDETLTFASGLNQPHGLAFHGGFLYVANT